MTKFMYPFFESIRLEDGTIHNWPLHKARIRHTCTVHFNQDMHTSQMEQAMMALPVTGLHKIRLEYNLFSFTITCTPYIIRTIRRCLLVEDNTIEYSYKYSDRSALFVHLHNLDPESEIIIIKNGFLTDTSYSNIACFDGFHWYTPQQPLLPGTRRQSLIQQGVLLEANITEPDLGRFQKICFINALLDLDHLSIEINKIIPSK